VSAGPVASAALLAGAYFLGTFPTALVVARSKGHDVLGQGSGNPGASNTYRVAGRRAGALVLAGDLLKGAVPTALGLVLGGRPLAMAAGAAAVVGHCWPVTRRFKGGKGVATAAGLTVVLFPAIAAACALVWAVTAKIGRLASVASLAATLTLVIGVVAFGRPVWEVVGVLALTAVVLSRHRSNLERLVKGREEVLP
jgi:acyl phosphate:glycerol-3-phosphate acyltransferase